MTIIILLLLTCIIRINFIIIHIHIHSSRRRSRRRRSRRTARILVPCLPLRRRQFIQQLLREGVGEYGVLEQFGGAALATEIGVEQHRGAVEDIQRLGWQVLVGELDRRRRQSRRRRLGSRLRLRLVGRQRSDEARARWERA